MKYYILLLLLPSFFYADASCIRGNCELGKGTFRFSDGREYSGEFQKKIPHGNGQMKYRNGDVYTGTFSQGMRSGQGTYTYRSGASYTGGFKYDKFNGEGKIAFANGDWYQGTWVANKMSGKGVFFYLNKGTYDGEWKNNKKHGSGQWTSIDGVSFTGIWKNNRLVKKRKAPTSYNKLKKNKIVEGSYKNCNKSYCHNEVGKFSYLDGSYFIGHFVKGNPEGKGTCYYANGDVYQGGWKNHSPDGEGIMTFASGRKYSAVWESGAPVRQLYSKPNIEGPSLTKKNRKAADGKTEIYALIIGISGYNHMPVLKYTDDDAYQLFAFLKSPEGGALPERNITILIDEVATKDNIKSSMKTLFNKADQDDMVLLYYSGHGLQGRFLPYDFDGYANSLSHSEIYDLLNHSEAKNKVVIADACYSGSLSSEKKVHLPSLTDFYDRLENAPGGTAILMSSKAEEVSLEYSGLRQGVFSHYLMKGMHGWADQDNDQIVSIHELYSYIYKNVREYTGNKQSPIISGKFNKNMPVSMVRKDY